MDVKVQEMQTINDGSKAASVYHLLEIATFYTIVYLRGQALLKMRTINFKFRD